MGPARFQFPFINAKLHFLVSFEAGNIEIRCAQISGSDSAAEWDKVSFEAVILITRR